MGGGTVGFEGEEIIAAASDDCLGDGVLGAHGVDGHDGAGQFEPLQKQRDRGDLVGLVLGRLLAEDKALAGRPGGDHMQRLPAGTAGMAAARGLAVDGDNVGVAIPQRLDPGRKAGLEQLRVECVHHVVERVVRWQPTLVGQEAAQKIQPLLTPEPDFNEILHPAQRRRQYQKHDLRQRVDHAPALTRIRQCLEMIQDGP